VETTKTLPYEDTSIRDTIKNLTKERDDLRDTLYKVDKNIQYIKHVMMTLKFSPLKILMSKQ